MAMTDAAHNLLPILQCEITDAFVLDLKDAELYRTIIYRNTGSNTPIPVSIKRKDFIYPYQCEEFRVIINGDELTSQDWEVKHQAYVQKLVINLETINLTNGQELKVTIISRWRDFYNFVNDFNYYFHYDDVASYSLIFRNFSLSNTLYILKINRVVATENTDYIITPDSVKFQSVQITPSEPFSVKLFSLSTPEKLGILDYQKGKPGTLFSDLSIILVQHLLSDSVHLIEAFVHEGALKENIFIVGIPYSTKHQTVKYLREKGYINIFTPNRYPFENDVVNAMDKAIQLCELGTTKKILVVEDGGYVVPLLHNKYVDKSNLFIGAVEQTANGIWRDRVVIESGSPLQIPVINVAESEIKLKLESPLIGRAVSKNIEIIYNKSYRGVAGIQIGIIGFGSTGSQIAETLKNMGAIITVFDNRQQNMEAALAKEFITGASIVDVVKNNEIIIEATGNLWTTVTTEMMEIIFAFKHNSYFVSGSSKRMGIDYNEFSLLVQDKKINIPGVGVKYKIKNSSEHEVILIADGYPVNFFLGESVPDRDIAFILAWLYKGAKTIAENQEKLPNEIIDTNDTNDPWGLLAAQLAIDKAHQSKMT